MSSKAYQPFLKQYRLKSRSPSNLLQALSACCPAAMPVHGVLEQQAAPHHPQPLPVTLPGCPHAVCVLLERMCFPAWSNISPVEH